MLHRLLGLLLVSVALAVAAATGPATVPPGPVTFANVCKGFTLKQVGTDLQVWCPGATKPWMTYRPCASAKARMVNGTVQITCNNVASIPLDTRPPAPDQ